ncbi:helix-turn-helix domain-containing protein, partial [Couchioplanes caeruleus subsp. azureus]
MDNPGQATTRRSLKPIIDGLTDEHRALVVRLRALREACGTSSAQIGRKVHCSPATLSRWLSGESFPDGTAVLRFAQVCADTDPQTTQLLWKRAAAGRAQPPAETVTVNRPTLSTPGDIPAPPAEPPPAEPPPAEPPPAEPPPAEPPPAEPPP